MRTLNAAALALLARITAGETIPWARLVHMDISPAQYLTTAGRIVSWSGQSWTPAGVALESVDDGVGDVNSLRITSPGVTPAQISLALSGDLEGQAVTVYDALIDPDDGTVADAVQTWAGTMGPAAIADGEEAVLIVDCEHRGVAAARAKPLRYTDEAQQRLFSGDTSLDRDPETDAAPIVWPAASFFKV